MKVTRLALIALAMGFATQAAATSVVPQTAITSPDGRIVVTVTVSGSATYSVSAGRHRKSCASRGSAWCAMTRTSRRGCDVTANYWKRVAQGSRRSRIATRS